MAKVKTLHCSFCEKTHHEVEKMIAGPNVCICDECVDLCSAIVQESRNIVAPERIALMSFTELRGVTLDKQHAATRMLIETRLRELSQPFAAT